jgi:hypothetical protein
MVGCRGLWRAGTAAGVHLLRGQNITGAPTLEAAKVACERHAEQPLPNIGGWDRLPFDAELHARLR